MSAPTGCTLVGPKATCDFTTWAPPIQDSDFSKSPSKIFLENINGVIPSNSFSGLTNADNDANSQMSLSCSFFNTWTLQLLSDSISSNLNWVEEVSIADCYSMNVASGAFSALTGATILTFLAGSFASLSGSAFSGMTSLQTLYLYANMPNTGIPSGLFSGLTALQTLDMSRTPMYSIPSGAFSDLSSLTTLVLEETSLTTLPSDAFYPLLSLTSLNLDYNNWTCDCALEWLEAYLTSTGITTTTCYLPSNLNGFDLQASIRSLTCVSSTTVSSTNVANSSDDDGWDWWMYAAIAGGSVALLAATIACICCCIYGMKSNNRKKDTKDPENKKTQNQKTHSKTNKTRPSRTDNVVKSKFTSSRQTPSLPSVEETVPRLNYYQPIKPPPYVRAEPEVSTPRSFRSGKVTPTNVKPMFYRSSMEERKANIEQF